MKIKKISYSRLTYLEVNIKGEGKKNYVTVAAEAEVTDDEMPEAAFFELRNFVESRIEAMKTLQELAK